MQKINLPEQGYTPTNYAKLVELTQLSNVAFCELFSIPKGTFEKHKAGTRTMKWQDWQVLLETVKQHLTTEQNKMKAYKFESHSKATKFMIDYYVNMCGYKLFEPIIEGGVFAVASKADDTILTLHDDKTIRKSTGHKRDNGVLTEEEYKADSNEHAYTADAASQDE